MKLISKLFFVTYSLLVFSSGTAFAFNTKAPSAILIEEKTGKVLFEKKPGRSSAPASLAKMMTLLLAMEDLSHGKVSLTDIVTASTKTSKTGGHQIFLKEGEEFPFEILIKTVAMASANDAAVAVAEHLSGSEEKFVERMNKRARELGMKSTRFANPHGLPNRRNPAKTTTRDLTILSLELMKHPMIFKWTGIRLDYIRDGSFMLNNTNKLIGKVPYIDGLKTGFINRSGFCVALTGKKDNMRLLGIVMGADSNDARFKLGRELMDYGWNNFKKVVIAPEEVLPLKIPVSAGKQDSVSIRLAKPLVCVVERNRAKDVRHEIFSKEEIIAPVKKGQVVGEIRMVCGDEVLDKAELLTDEAIEKSGFFSQLF
ncbi:MAG: D-alanyl-D-alanine carboxypeptidase family protein [Candidatus Theseobacter exili]|nr:D-alanyl-D-alanine carboxypeptidase family protein [Candidatus Theseobacter exili]